MKNVWGGEEKLFFSRRESQNAVQELSEMKYVVVCKVVGKGKEGVGQ